MHAAVHVSVTYSVHAHEKGVQHYKIIYIRHIILCIYTAIFILIVGCGSYPMISKSSNLKLSMSSTFLFIFRVGNGRGSLVSCQKNS